jgi:protein HOOK3
LTRTFFESIIFDSAEAAIALRQRLNETIDQLDTLRNAHMELEVKFESQSRELTIAKSDRKPSSRPSITTSDI